MQNSTTLTRSKGLLLSRLIALTLALPLSGCIFGGGDEDEVACELALGEALCRAGPKSCVSITGGNTATQFDSTNCSGCSVAEAPKAIDGDRSSFATVSLPAVTVGSAALRATAQQGLVFPAGDVAAAVLSEGTDDSRLHVRTYLGGAFQEEGSNSSVTQDNITILGFKTSKQFDAVELVVDGMAGAAQGTEAEAVRIREFCSDGEVNPFE